MNSYQHFSFRKTLCRINRDQDSLLNTENVASQPGAKKTNIKKKTGTVKTNFESEVKEEIGKLEGQMKIGKRTIRRIAEKVRAKRYPDCPELKYLKFSKESFENRLYVTIRTL